MTTELKTLIKDNQELPLSYTLKMLKEQPEIFTLGGVWLEEEEPELLAKLITELEELLN